MALRSHGYGHPHHHMNYHRHGHNTEYVTVVTEVDRMTAVTENPCHYGGAVHQQVVRKEVFEEVDEEHPRRHHHHYDGGGRQQVVPEKMFEEVDEEHPPRRRHQGGGGGRHYEAYGNTWGYLVA